MYGGRWHGDMSDWDDDIPDSVKNLRARSARAMSRLHYLADDTAMELQYRHASRRMMEFRNPFEEPPGICQKTTL
jgi:hypothetical protein